MVVLFQNECELTLVFMREHWLWCVVSASYLAGGLRWKAWWICDDSNESQGVIFE